VICAEVSRLPRLTTILLELGAAVPPLPGATHKKLVSAFSNAVLFAKETQPAAQVASAIQELLLCSLEQPTLLSQLLGLNEVRGQLVSLPKRGLEVLKAVAAAYDASSLSTGECAECLRMIVRGSICNAASGRVVRAGLDVHGCGVQGGAAAENRIGLV